MVGEIQQAMKNLILIKASGIDNITTEWFEINNSGRLTRMQCLAYQLRLLGPWHTTQVLRPRTGTRNSYQKLGSCVMHSGTRFFWYEKLGSNRIVFYAVPETWNHVTQMHLSHWSSSFVYILYRLICT